MSRLLKYLIFLQLLLGSVFAQQESIYFKADYPDFIPYNNSFELSIIISNTEKTADSVSLTLYSPSNLVFNTGILVNDSIESELYLKKTGASEYSSKTIKTGFPVRDSAETKYYQLKFDIQPQQFSMNSSIKFNLTYFNDSSIVAEYSSFSIENDLKLPQAEFEFYEPQSVAGKCFGFNNNENLSLNIPSEKKDNLLIEFWMKLNSKDLDFLNILGADNDTLLTVSSNKFQILEVKNSEVDQILDSFFLSKNSWYHFALYIPQNDLQNYFYVNDKLIFKLPKFSQFNLDNITLEFNGNKENDFFVDGLRLWDFRDKIEQLFKNKHYRNITTDSSEVLLSLDFDETDFPGANKLDNIGVSFSDANLAVSQAPIYTKIPDLNVIPYQNFYSISWSPRNTEYVKQYILERSSGGKGFQEIHSLEVNDDGENKTYEYTDSRQHDQDIVYYRLKQINQDSTIIYSASTKIGQAEIEQFDVHENYPNPFNPITKITVEMYQETEVRITIYNLVGKKISTLYTGNLGKGVHNFTFNGEGLPSGIYLCEVQSKYSTVVQKMVLAK
jgi:hypothetical protein